MTSFAACFTTKMKTLTEHKRTVENSRNRTETGQSPARRKSKLPKTHQDYWFGRVRKRTYVTPNGTVEIEIPTWQVRLFHVGKEGWFNLDTANQAAAAGKARDIYIFLKANGWDAALVKFKPESTVVPQINLTIGQYLNAVNNTGYLRTRTRLNYENCLRTIVSEMFGVRGDESRFDYRQGGNQKWVERINSFRLERVTPSRISQWQQKRLRKAGHSPIAIASAKRTANSYVRCARSLFSAEIRKRLKGVKLPSVLPFDGVELFESGSMKYVSKIDVNVLVAAAKNELKPKEPEAYKAFLLALFAGMRKAEIDLCEWRMVDWLNGIIKLEETEWLRLKTQDSAGVITVEPEPLSELRELMPLSQSPFIITSERPPRNDSARTYYRCEPVFDCLNEWLRSKGVKANKPLHELRKEIGSWITTKDGIYAASQFLRHSDITTTARHYTQHRTRISAGLGKLLDTQIKPAAQQ
jgi:integrase